MGWKKRIALGLVLIIALWLLWGTVEIVKWWVLVIIGIPITVIAGLLFAYFFLAKPSQNRWFTFVKEGTAKIVVRGDKFEKALIQWEGYTLSEEIKKDGKGKIIQDKWDIIKGEEKGHPLGGFRYYGFWPFKDMYAYDFEWTGVKENGEIIHHPKETLDYILLKDDVYWAKVEQAEDKELLPLEVEIILTIRIINPYKALFNVQNWLEIVINRIKPWVRDAVTHDTYENLIKQPDRIGEEMYGKLKDAGLLENEFIARYGVDVRKIEVKEINPPKEYRDVTLRKYTAEQEKKRIVIEAEAEAERLNTVYGKIQQFEDLGRLVRTLEAVEKSPLAASLTVQAVPGLPEALKGIFGKSADTISQKEFRELKEMVEKLVKEKK